MKTKTVMGWIFLLFICIIPVFLWFIFGPGTANLVDYASITHSLGQLTGLVGMTMFAMTFLLSTRIDFIEDVFGGLDKAYIVHGILGGTALIFILFHPILLVLKYIPQQMALAGQYLSFSSSWSVNFGIIALLTLVLLIVLTLYVKMRYHTWKFTHEFLGLAFLFAVFHIFLVRNTVAQDNIFDGYFIYATIVSIIGVFGFLYSLFIKGRYTKHAIYTVSNIKKKNTFFEIIMVPNHKPIAYKSGQFIFVRFYNHKLSKEAHPFSLASRSNNPNIRIIIKKLGDFTNQLDNLQVGDKVAVEGPYGRFNYVSNGKDQVWVAAGIGVTPFLGMVQDLDNTRVKEKIFMYYSVADEPDFIGTELLEETANKINSFKYIPWNAKKQGFITVNDISKQVGKLTGKEFFICGPPRFKEAIINGLVSLKISKDDIHEEVFDFK